MLKKYVLTSLLGFISIAVWAQSTTGGQTGVQWQKCYGGLKNDVANCIIPNTDGGYTVVGTSESGGVRDSMDVLSNFGGSDYWVMKIASNGTLKWQQHYGGSANDVANQAMQLSDGGFLISGYTFSLNGDVSNHSPLVTNTSGEEIPNADVWIIKINSEGAIQWEKALGGSYIDESFSMIETKDHHIMLSGFSSSNNGVVTNNHGGYDFWVINLDMLGNVNWTKTYGGSGDDRANNIIECKDGGFLVTGYSSSSDKDASENFGLYDFWILRLTNDGSILWEKSFGGSRDDRAFSAVETGDGGFAIGGFTWSDNVYVNHIHGEQDAWLVKIDSYGNLQWEKTYGGSKNDNISSVLIAADGGFILVGNSFSSDGNVALNHGSSDCWLTKLNAVGDFEWSHSYGGSSSDELNSVLFSSDGGFVLAGSSLSKDGDVTLNHGNQDVWILKLAPSVNVAEKADASSAFKIFPNPSLGLSVLSGYDSSSSNITDISVCDISGKLIWYLAMTDFSNKTEALDFSTLENGMYFITLYTSNSSNTQKLIIQK